ncbi:MAG: exosortase/archaeosortase family protein [Candidatus Diapherotrites archaeon]|nr:exosortase/archaeosortase family protein [Candidatus Diapherotrites archaeon]
MQQKKTKAHDRNRLAARFLVLFLVLYAVLQFLLVAAPLGFLERFLAELVSSLLGLSTFRNAVFVGNDTFTIDNQCTGLASAIVLASVVFALRKPDLKRKIAMVVGGGVVLFLLNIPRLLLVLWSAKAFGIGVAQTVHVASWFLTTAFILGAWYVLATKASGVKSLDELL